LTKSCCACPIRKSINGPRSRSFRSASSQRTSESSTRKGFSQTPPTRGGLRRPCRCSSHDAGIGPGRVCNLEQGLERQRAYIGRHECSPIASERRSSRRRDSRRGAHPPPAVGSVGPVATVARVRRSSLTGGHQLDEIDSRGTYMKIMTAFALALPGTTVFTAGAPSRPTQRQRESR
jgi:hypothetical protein